MANFLGISQQAYSKLENGETKFAEKMIDRILSFFDVTRIEFDQVFEALSIGNKNYNRKLKTDKVDGKFLKSYEKLFDRNQELYEKLIKEKNERIKLLEKLSELKGK